ncbi:MAG TPA: OmpA family protein [Thermohalobaculum sp.]|nr:OmpA family protein [Thermohalobaculum sp.]
MQPPKPIAFIAAAGVLAALAGPPPAAASMLEPRAVVVSTAGQPARQVWLTLERHSEGIRLRGRVPDALTGTVLGTYAAALFGADRVETDLARPGEDGAALPDWTRSAMAAADTLAEVPEGAAEVTEGAVRVTGRVEAPEEAGRLTRALRAKLPPGVRVSTEFAVAVPDVVAAVTLSAERCAYLMTRLAAERQVLFASGSVEIDESSLPGLATIAGLFDRCPDAEIEVSGYTDSKGDEQMNLDLSQARAEAVMAELLDRGVPLRRLRARGFGEADPVASNETEAGRARNRRIEFRAVE